MMWFGLVAFHIIPDAIILDQNSMCEFRTEN